MCHPVYVLRSPRYHSCSVPARETDPECTQKETSGKLPKEENSIKKKWDYILESFFFQYHKSVKEYSTLKNTKEPGQWYRIHDPGPEPIL